MGFFIITLSTLLYLSVGILLKCGKHLHDCLISPREECQPHKTSLTLSLFNEVSVLRQESERSSNLLEVSNLPLSTILMFDFGIVPTVWYFGIVPTVWYFGIVLQQCGILELFQQCGILELFQQFGICLFFNLSLKTKSKFFWNVPRIILCKTACCLC